MVHIAGGNLGNKPGLVKASLNNIFVSVKEIVDATAVQLKETTRDARDRYASISYLMSSEKNRREKILKDLAN